MGMDDGDGTAYARGVQEVETPVPKVVYGSEVAETEARVRKGDFSNITTLVVAFFDRGVWVRRIAGHESLFKTRPNDQSGGSREGRGVTGVVPMEVAARSCQRAVHLLPGKRVWTSI